MPTSAIIDTAIGLTFVYFVTSALVSHILEYINAHILGVRAQYLEVSLRNMLADPMPKKGPPPAGIVTHFFGHSLIQGLTEPNMSTGEPLKDKRPAYIPSRTFALALMDVIAPAQGTPGTIAQLEAQIALLPEGNAKESLTTLVTSADGKMEAAVANIEDWYNSSMERATGWYKRYTQKILLVLSLAFVVLFNIDSISLVETFWTNPTLRASVVASAMKSGAQPAGTAGHSGTVNPGSTPSAAPTVMPTATAVPGASPAAPGTTKPGAGTGDIPGVSKAAGGQVADQSTADAVSQKELADEMGQLNSLPIGWHAANPPAFPMLSPFTEGEQVQAQTDLAGQYASKLAGWLITVLCVSLGAPFWFNFMNQFINLRQGGSPPGDKKS